MKTPNLELVEVSEADTAAAPEINASFWQLDAIVQLSVVSQTLDEPPASVTQGDRYIVAAGASGSLNPWAGKSQQVAYYAPSGWLFFKPDPGWFAYVQAENILVRFTGGAWVEFSGGGGGGGGGSSPLTTKGDIWVYGDGGDTRLPVGPDGRYFLIPDSTAPEGVKWQAFGVPDAPTLVRGATWVRALDAIATPVNDVYIRIPTACTIVGVSITTIGGAGGCLVDIWKAPWADFPPTIDDTIFQGSPAGKPQIIGGTKYEDTTLAGVDTSIDAGDVLAFHLESVSTFTAIFVTLHMVEPP